MDYKESARRDWKPAWPSVHWSDVLQLSYRGMLANMQHTRPHTVRISYQFINKWNYWQSFSRARDWSYSTPVGSASTAYTFVCHWQNAVGLAVLSRQSFYIHFIYNEFDSWYSTNCCSEVGIHKLQADIKYSNNSKPRWFSIQYKYSINLNVFVWVQTFGECFCFSH